MFLPKLIAPLSTHQPRPATSGVFYCLKAVVSNITAPLDGAHNLSH